MSHVFLIKQLTWRYCRLDESTSCLRNITLLFRTLVATDPAEGSGDSASNQQWTTDAPQLHKLEKLVFKRLISQTGFPRL